jgi:hypothetical protein
MFAKLRTAFRQTYCGLRGHDYVKHCTKAGINLKCMNCAHETRGWETGGRGPQHRYDGDNRHIMQPITRRI